MTAITADGAALHGAANAELVARLERLPITPRLMLIRGIVGIATFFDGYTVLAIAFAMPSLISEWKITPTEVGLILSAGYVGQLFGAVIFGSLAEKYGRLKTLFITIVLFVSMDIACLLAWSGVSMMVFRFFQGVGTGGEVPVASAYINEFIGAEKRGPLLSPLRGDLPDRVDVRRHGRLLSGTDLWLEGDVRCRPDSVRADQSVALVQAGIAALACLQGPHRGSEQHRRETTEDNATRRGVVLREPVVRPVDPRAIARADWRELFQGIYLKVTLTIWGLWVQSFMINNGMITRVAHALQAGVPAAFADQPRVRLDHL